MNPRTLPLLTTALSCLLASTFAQDATPAPAAAIPAATSAAPQWPNPNPPYPATLPGRGLAQHDFFYAGEARTQDMFIVRKGAVVWEFHNPGSKGEISDAVLLSNGNVLFAHQYGVTLLGPDQKVLWNFDAPDKCEIHTAVPIGQDKVLFVINGPEPKLRVVKVPSGETIKELPLTVGNPGKTHGQFRHVRLTAAGTLLVAHMDHGKVVEYDSTGAEVWSLKVPSPWSAVRLANGHTLIASNQKFVREVNPQGATVWEVTPADLPEYKVAGFQVPTRLPNGNTLINNWINQWNGAVEPAQFPVQAWELTPDKKVIWALRENDQPNLGPATIIQLLDEPSTPEALHFGDLR